MRDNGKNFLTVDDVAKELQYSPQTVRRMAKGGVIPFIQLGGRKSKWRLSRERFDKWVRERYN